jgi:hypothetical protein
VDLLIPLARRRSRLFSPWWAYAVLAVYVVLVGVLVAHHEPWFDEAQAWLLARDTGPRSLFMRALRYEGSPGLWHALLMLLAKAGAPYHALNILSALLGCLAAYLFVRYSPFPWPIKIIFPFAYFVFYQYVVVARSYALLAPLLFSVAVVYPRRFERVYLFTLLLVLIANVSLHGTLIAAALMGIHVLQVVRRYRTFDASARTSQLACAGMFAVAMVLLVVQLLPPKDLAFPHVFRPSLASITSTTLAMLNGSMAGKMAVSALAIAAGLWWFQRSGYLLVYLLPTAAIIVFSAGVYRNAWHEGILFLVFVFALWVSMATKPATARMQRWSANLALATFAAVLIVQLIWSKNAFFYDYAKPYSGSKALADYLHHRPADQVVYGTGFPSIAIMPYFDHNIYRNYHEGRWPSFWFWSSQNDMVVDPSTIVKKKPDLIVLSVKFPGSDKQPAQYPGYRVLASFPGALYWKDRASEPDGYILLERQDRTAVPTPAR